MRTTAASLAVALALACGPSKKTSSLDNGATPTPKADRAVRAIPDRLLASPQPDALRVSLVRLLADPEALHGKTIKVGGFAHVVFEGDSLCLHRDDVEYRVVTNYVWLDLPQAPEVRALSDQYVAVVGVVDGRRRGHFGMYQATITQVSQFAALPRRDEEPADGPATER